MSAPDTALPAYATWPVLLPHAGRVILFDPRTGVLETLAPAALPTFATPILTCYAPRLLTLLGQRQLPHCADILELYAFACPAQPCPPTIAGIAAVLGHDAEIGEAEDAALYLPILVAALLQRVKTAPDQAEMQAILTLTPDWIWCDTLRFVSGKCAESDPALTRLLHRLLTWSTAAPRPETPAYAITDDAALARLTHLRDTLHGSTQEARDDQQRYATAITGIFTPADTAQVVVAEAGTGVGKTLGYLAPSLAWTDQTGGQVWISTYTRALQRQITHDLERLPPIATDTPLYATRKGRENYACLLNFEDAVKRVATSRTPRDAVLAALMARWIAATKDGDITGADFPAWIGGLFGAGAVQSFADKRGECIYAGCPHFSKCFGERAIRKADTASIIVANHAVTLLQAASALQSPSPLPGHMVIDEGHQLFAAADNVFTLTLTGQAGQDLRRWILGLEDGGRSARSRLRGLKRRVEDVCASDLESEKALHAIIQHARILPSHGWAQRVQTGEGVGPFEEFLAAVANSLHDPDDPRMTQYGREVSALPVPAGVRDALPALHQALAHLQSAMLWLADRCTARLDEDTEGDLDTTFRDRLTATAASLRTRVQTGIAGWIDILQNLRDGTYDDRHLLWFNLQRDEGGVQDLGVYRGWIDPTLPMATLLSPQVQGLAITSATLRDKHGNTDPALAWQGAKMQTGVMHLSPDPTLVTLPSPFDYAAQTRVFILTDVAQNDVSALARAYQDLFLASGGGALGLFTAIQRLRAVHHRLQTSLQDAGLNLYAQHIDPMDTGTLVDIFRHDVHACLLGTDALRDGVDVPGDALRLLVFDKIPWPRPTLMHQARRAHFGGRGYDDRLTRYRLKQAYGRLIRRSDDRGVFVLCNGPLPGKLQDAFPPGVEIARVTLAEAVQGIKQFLQPIPQESSADQR